MKSFLTTIVITSISMLMTSCSENGGSHTQQASTAQLEQRRQDSIREAKATEEAERVKKEKEEREEQERIEAEKKARGPEWLRGGFCHERIDPIAYEMVYEVFYFENDGTYRFGESRSTDRFKPSNRPFKYNVRDNVIYDEEGEPFLKINNSNQSLSRYNDSSCIFSKV